MTILKNIKECLSDDSHVLSSTRVGFFIALLFVILFTAADVYYKHEFDTLEFCGGVTALFVGFGIAKKSS